MRLSARFLVLLAAALLGCDAYSRDALDRLRDGAAGTTLDVAGNGATDGSVDGPSLRDAADDQPPPRDAGDAATRPDAVVPRDAGPDAGTITLSFQNGVAPTTGYAGCVDTFLREAAPSTSSGSAAFLAADGDEPDGSGHDEIILFRWDLREIPRGSVVRAVSLTIRIFDGTVSPGSFHEVQRGWSEAEATWLRATASVAWAAPGASGLGDRAGQLMSASMLPASANTRGFTTAAVAVVQRWVDNPDTNYGLLLAVNAGSDRVQIRSSQALPEDERPRLRVTFVPP